MDSYLKTKNLDRIYRIKGYFHFPVSRRNRKNIIRFAAEKLSNAKSAITLPEGGLGFITFFWKVMKKILYIL